MPLALPIFQVERKKPFIWHTSSVTLIYLTKNYMFLCLLESNNAWKKAVRIFAFPFSIYFAIRHEPIQSNLLMKICQQPKVRERNWWFAIIHTPCIRFNRFCFGSFCVFFYYRRTVFLAAELLTSSKWVSHDITRTNQIKRTEKSSASFVGLFMRERIDRITRTWYSHPWNWTSKWISLAIEWWIPSAMNFEHDTRYHRTKSKVRFISLPLSRGREWEYDRKLKFVRVQNGYYRRLYCTTFSLERQVMFPMNTFLRNLLKDIFQQCQSICRRNSSWIDAAKTCLVYSAARFMHAFAYFDVDEIYFHFWFVASLHCRAVRNWPLWM